MHMTTTVHLASGTTLSHTTELDREVFDMAEVYLRKPVTAENFTGDTMAEVMNKVFEDAGNDGLKLTRFVVGPHFIFVSQIAAMSYEVVDLSEADMQAQMAEVD